MTGGPPFSVVICTRNRPEKLAATLAALEHQTRRDFELIVVDQSTVRASDLGKGVVLIRDDGRGLARARNLGAEAAASDWVAYLDDDCLTEPDWAAELARAIAEHPEASLVSGHVAEHDVPRGDYLRVSVFEVDEERVRSGRWTRPWHVGLGVCVAIRRDAIARLGGFDVRLGAGAPDFPAAEDMDFNYRLLRSGGVAYATPRVRAVHDQWRTPGDLGPLYRGYMTAWAGFAVKHIKQGDLAGGLWLWGMGVVDASRMLASAARRRSRLRLRVGLWKLRGLARGTTVGLRTRW